MGKRILSGVIVTVLAVTALLLGGTLLAGVLLIVSCTAYRELCKAVGVHRKAGMDILENIGYLGIAAYYFLIWQAKEELTWISPERTRLFLLLLFVVIFMLMMAVYVLTFPRYRSEQVMAAFFCILYAPLMLSFIYLTERMENGSYIVWMILISSWVCDTCAYFTGMRFGRHKLAPVLSPKKTIEGAIGGVAGSAAVGALYALLLVQRVMPQQNAVWLFAILGGVGAVISQIGDLAASAIKRNHDIKDYGTCIPGHGGIMDRFDSVIFTAPMIYFMAQLWIGV